VDPRIVGGKEVQPPFSFPWMAAIVYANKPNSYDGQVCGAVIIGPRHALTAAHCANPNKNMPHMSEALAVEAGRHDLSRLAEEENPPHSEPNRVLEIYRHVPRHDLHDVAVLVLEREYPPEVYSSLALNQDTSLGFQAGLKVTSIGWGATDVAGKQYPKKLQTLDLEVLDHDQCGRWYKNYGQVHDFEFCAGYAGKDTCFGDSGGPTFRVVDGSYVLLGIESWGGEKCALANRPGVRASVAHHYDFIKSKLGNLVAPTVTPPAQVPSPQCSALTGGRHWQHKCTRVCNNHNMCKNWCANKCSASCACNQARRLLSSDHLV